MREEHLIDLQSTTDLYLTDKNELLTEVALKAHQLCGWSVSLGTSLTSFDVARCPAKDEEPLVDCSEAVVFL
jgi:hypothetical protein